MSEQHDGLHSNSLLKFRAVLSSHSKEIAKCVSEEEFLEILNSLKLKRSIIKRLHKVLEEDLFQTLESDVQALTSDECVIEGITKMDKLIAETTVPPDVHVWRPPGDVKLHLRSCYMEKIKKEYEALKQYKITKQKENQDLTKLVFENRKRFQPVNDHMKQLLNVPYKLSELEKTVKFNIETAEKSFNNLS